MNTMASLRDAWSVWAGDHQIRWSGGRVHGTPELVAELNSRLAVGGMVPVTPTGPFPEADVNNPDAVAALVRQILYDWGERGVGSSPNTPVPPPLPEGVVG